MKKKFIKFLLVILIIVLGFIAFASYYIFSAGKPFKPNSKENISIEVMQGATIRSISDELEKQGVIKSAFAFRIYCKIHGHDRDFKAGSYIFSPSMDAEKIATELKTGKVNNISFTIPEGYTVKQIAEKLSKEGIADYNKFMDVAANGDFDFSFLKDAVKGEDRLEGFLFPDTYLLSANSSEKEIIAKMLSRFDEVYSKEYRKKAKAMGYSDKQIITIASIIERETVLDDERAKVSSVIYNRLKEEKKLEMCSTVQFVLGIHKQFLSYEDTSIESPYNTYINKGLPPGPIACPGEASIKAALNPAKTDYLYFVVSSKGDGSMEFSKDYDEFLANKEKYYASIEGKK